MTDNEIIKACGEVCTDNRFELIAKYKQLLIDSTNIETAQGEMAVIDSILFRCWLMGWLDKLEEHKRQRAEINELTYKLECLLCHATGGKLSKASYTLETMERVVTDYINDSCYETEAEIRNETINEFTERLCAGRVSNDPVVIAAKCLEKEMTEGV